MKAQTRKKATPSALGMRGNGMVTTPRKASRLGDRRS
jgi:hypothetical protein